MLHTVGTSPRASAAAGERCDSTMATSAASAGSAGRLVGRPPTANGFTIWRTVWGTSRSVPKARKSAVPPAAEPAVLVRSATSWPASASAGRRVVR